MDTLPFGTRGLELPAPLREAALLQAPGLDGAAPDEPALGRALHDAALWAARRLRGGGGRVAIIVPDRTRPLPLRHWLPRLWRAFDAAGVSGDQRYLVSASGIHAPMTAEELGSWVGEDVIRCGARLEPHDADGESVFVGTTSAGLDVHVHPRLVEAEAVLAMGRLVFHYLAGYGGGRKMIAPGCAARATVLSIHRRCLDDGPQAGRHPLARAGCLEGNPVHLASCDVAALFPSARGVHVGLDREGRASLATFGDLVDAHAEAARLYGQAHRVTVSRRVPALVVSAGGYPVDRDLVQAHKALDAVAPILEDGAEVLLVARCQDGVGNPEVFEALQRGPARVIAQALRESFRVGAHSALALREKTERFHVSYLGELEDAVLNVAGMRRVSSLQSWFDGLSPKARGAGVTCAPRGASLLYSVEGEEPGL